MHMRLCEAHTQEVRGQVGRSPVLPGAWDCTPPPPVAAPATRWDGPRGLKQLQKDGRTWGGRRLCSPGGGGHQRGQRQRQVRGDVWQDARAGRARADRPREMPRVCSGSPASSSGSKVGLFSL